MARPRPLLLLASSAARSIVPTPRSRRRPPQEAPAPAPLVCVPLLRVNSTEGRGGRRLNRRVKGPQTTAAGVLDDEEEEEEEEEEEAALIEEMLRKDARRRRERADSVSEAMLADRRRHLRRLREEEPDPQVLQRILALGLGRKQTGKDTPRYRQQQEGEAIGAAGFATYLAASSGGDKERWPSFKHMLPEVAMAGHSNCGKSSLVNALAGLAPKRGPARVSDRAGWTDAVFFYQLGKKPPLLTLADLPGYGHAVASVQQKRRWREMTHGYLRERGVLSLCCVLVDSVRGLCREDKDLLRMLKAQNVPTKLVLTKGDLLGPDSLAQAHAVVCSDAAALGVGLVGWEGDGGVAMVSSGTGAGVSALFKDMVQFTRRDVIFEGDVGFHRAAIQ